LPRAFKAGVPLISGSESGWSADSYGQWHARELQTFVEMFGLSPLQAINAATLTATRCLKRFGHESASWVPPEASGRRPWPP